MTQEEWQLQQEELSAQEAEMLKQQAEQEFIEQQNWEENMNSLYTYGEDGFCDGFTNR